MHTVLKFLITEFFTAIHIYSAYPLSALRLLMFVLFELPYWLKASLKWCRLTSVLIIVYNNMVASPDGEFSVQIHSIRSAKIRC